MSTVGLLFVGAVLLLNGLVLLGEVDARSAAPFNLFVGSLQTAVPLWLLTHAATPEEVIGAAGILLFGFTYLYVGISTLAGLGGTALGWYSLWVAVLAIGFGVVSITRLEDVATGLLWFQWSVLWGLFFVVVALGRAEWTRLAGWLAVTQSVTTCTGPAFALLLGVWGSGVTDALAASMILTAVALTPVALRRHRPERSAPTATAEPLPLAS